MSKHFIQLEPSMIAANWAAMGEEAKLCESAGAEILHLDVMDGHFVPNLTMGPDLVGSIKRATPNLILDVHLMCYAPERLIEPFIKMGADEITFHLEATEDVEYLIEYIRRCNNTKVGLAIKPETSESLILKYLDKVDKILIMTVEPGFGGQEFIEKMLEKVEFLREQAEKSNLMVDIQVDGGVDYDTAEKSIVAGANRLVCGSFFFKQADRGETMKRFNELRKLRDFK